MTLGFIINYSINGHIVNFWFVKRIIEIYCMIPLITYIKKENKISIFLFISILLIISDSLIPFLIQTTGYQFHWDHKIKFSNEFAIFIFIGYLIHNYDISAKIIYILYLLGFFGFLFHLKATEIISIRDGKINGSYKRVTQLPNVLHTTALFFFIKYNYDIIFIVIRKKFVKFLNRYTLPIYLMQNMFIEEFWGLVYKMENT